MSKNLNKNIIESLKSTIIIGFISISFILIVDKNLKDEIAINISEVNTQVEARIATYINNNMSKLESFNSYIKYDIDKYGSENAKQIFVDTFNKSNVSNSFKGIGIINKAGYLIYENRKIYVGNSNYFKESIKGKKYVSKPTKSIIDGKDSIIYSIPFIINDKIEGVLVGFSHYEGIALSLKQSIYSYKGSLYIVDKYGNVIIGNEKNKEGIKTLYNKIKYLDRGKEKTNISNCKNPKLGIFNNERIYLYYNYIENTDGWYLVSITPINKVFSSLTNIINISLLTIFIATLLYVINNYKKYVKNKKALRKATYIDSLTNINNQIKFKIDCKKKLKNAQDDDKYVLVSIDINRLKFINDVFGYEEGDNLIKSIGEKLSILKFENIHGRISNDIFALMFKLDKKLDLKTTLVKLHDYINIVCSNNSDLNLKLNMGAYIIENTTEEIDKIIDNANIARLESKKVKDKPYYIYDEALKNRISQEIIIESELKKGLESGEFKVVYQPKVDINNEKIVGAEALIRWNHNKKGFISPNIFIPIAEKNGNINLIGKWVLEEVCKDIKKCKLKGEKIVPISINLSRVELYRSDLIQSIKQTIEKYDVEPELIEVEITETAALNDIEYINNKIYQIKKLGIKVSMDDFGTGTSTLSNLKLIDIDILKLDRTMIIDLEEDKKTFLFVKTIIKLAKKFNFKVVCEGVENNKQVDILRQFNCDMIQGYVYFKPLEFLEFKNILKEQYQ